MPSKTPCAIFRHIPLADLSGDELLALSRHMKLSLSKEDMLAVQKMFAEEKREPTDVELEVIAQTWSEHCKHRIFGALIEHTVDGRTEIVDGLFKTCIKAVTERIISKKPGFVLSAFTDNAGFVKLDDNFAVCLKAETHNHPSAIEPYAGANTGLGGVIRDILGAGRGAKPIASLDVFCFGPPDTHESDIRAKDVIHPLGILRGVVRGVRDYGNRMGIPTTSGAIAFDKTYIYNPLVFCGTMGLIPIKDIGKEVKPGHILVVAGGRTGRDGLKGATFSSVSLTTASHEEDQTAVQIGNPIEEKKVADFILAAREQGLIQFVTDCGAGGFSSAAGEMLSEVGGEIWLENAPLKVDRMESWQIFISESQERMVIATEEKDLAAMRRLAAVYETEFCVLGKADGSGILKVKHFGEEVCRLDCRKLHEAPRRKMRAEWVSAQLKRPSGEELRRAPLAPPSDGGPERAGREKLEQRVRQALDEHKRKAALEGTLTPQLEAQIDSRFDEVLAGLSSLAVEEEAQAPGGAESSQPKDERPRAMLRRILADFAIVSREPIIREYDHEVQGNTVIKPLAGASGDAPQDGSVIRVDGSRKLVALATALLPEWGKTDPRLMGRATVDECVRQLVAMGANPEKIAILDNFCVGNPDDARELGALVEATKGLAQTAEIYGTPFVSGKDSFYNYFKTEEGSVSIPCTLLVSGFGIVEDSRHVVGTSLRRPGNRLCLVGCTRAGLRGSVYLRIRNGIRGDGRADAGEFPQEFDEAGAFGDYQRYHQLVSQGVVLSAHDVGEGGLAVALAEMGFSDTGGVKVDLRKCPHDFGPDPGAINSLFAETPARIVFEIAPENAHLAEELGFPVIGDTTRDRRLVITEGETTLIDAPLDDLKGIWKSGLVQYY